MRSYGALLTPGREKPVQVSGERTAGRAMAAIAILFFVKAVVLAFWITPLWDVPDETGHWAIVDDLARGRGFPLPGRSVVPSDVVSDWMRGKPAESPMGNWVAQHPPLYHLLAAPLLSAARGLTSDHQWLYRTPRLLSVIGGSSALLLFFRAFLEASGDPLLSFAAAAGVGSTPMYSHMSSGTNHDIFLAFCGGLVALCWVRFERSGLFSDGLKTAAALSLAGTVKLSAVVLAAALWLLSLSRLATRGSRRLAQWIVIGATSVSLPALWTLRHWWLTGHRRSRLLAGAAAAAVFGFCFLWLYARAEGSEPVKRLLYSALTAVPFLALPLLFGKRKASEAILSGSHFVFLVFSLAYLANSFEAYEIYGQMRATNGRYFFAVLPFLIFAFVFPAASVVRKGRWRDISLLLMLAVLFVNEAAFFLVKVIPFY